MGVYAGRAWSRARFRNNLFIGGLGGGTYDGYSNGDGRVLQVADADAASCDFDYDGFGSIGTGTFRGRVGATSFASLAELRARTSEAHAVEVDLSIFAAPFDFPAAPFPARTVPDLRLGEGVAVDAGERLATINDGFTGAAPDLGAYERGAPLPDYGPRGAAVCGDGVRQDGEECDDGNTASGDGCSDACVVERADGGVPPASDGGAIEGRDAASAADASALDAGAELPPGADGCGCRAAAAARAPAFLFALALVGLARRRSKIVEKIVE
ncbi:MAG: hypothetical protein KF729_15440 [Sandaracinaceae bacterium]|nr:hypothetical protein [Sandaracinaceae bacterium]